MKSMVMPPGSAIESAGNTPSRPTYPPNHEKVPKTRGTISPNSRLGMMKPSPE